MSGISFRRAVLFFGLPVLLIALGLYATAYLQRNAALHGTRREEESQGLLTAMLNQETGARGFFQTRLPVFLQPYTLGDTAFASDLPRLRTSLSGSPSLERMLERQAQLAARWQGVAHAEIVSLERFGRVPSTAESLSQKVLMDAYRADNARLDDALARDLRSNLAVATTIATAVAVLLVAALIAISLLTRRSVRREDARQLREVRDRERAERDSRARLQSIFDHVPAVLALRDLSGRYEHVNTEFLRTFGNGMAVDTAIGRRPEELFPDQVVTGDILQQRDLRERALLAGEQTITEEMTFQILGSPREFLTVRYPVTDANHDITGLGVFMFDVTDRNRAVRDLRDANLKLLAASQAKDRFLASMSHELRTPLNAILGFTGTILMGLVGSLNDEQTNQLRTVQSSGRHLLSLINDLLDVARIESGTQELELETIDCGELCEAVAAGLRPLAGAKGLELGVTPSAGRREVRSDRRALQQILINLASNAIKFTDQGGVVLLVTQHDHNGDTVTRFTVSDTGRGIELEAQERLFEAFEQIRSSTLRPQEGSGLGLYISQTLASFVGATITLESEVGTGSTFTLELSGR